MAVMKYGSEMLTLRKAEEDSFNISGVIFYR